MKKVLMITYFFPPADEGNDRALKFATALENFGWEPIVLTREDRRSAKSGTMDDSSIPEGIDVYRTNPWDIDELPGLLGVLGRLAGRVLFNPDRARLWEYFSRRKAARIVKNEGIDLIYTISEPLSPHLAGLYLKRKFPRIPWVADFRSRTPESRQSGGSSTVSRLGAERKLRKLVLEKADILASDTYDMLRAVTQDRQNDYPEEKLFAIPDGCTEEISGAFEKACRFRASKKLAQY